MVHDADIDAVLRTILDPEMPVNIVDLGIVHAVRVESAAGEAAGAAGQPEVVAEPSEAAAGQRAAALGMKPTGAHVTVEITPTFVGCPALDLLARQIRERVGALPEVLGVSVNFVYAPAWTIDRISDAGREALRRHGVTVPQRGAPAQARIGGASRSVPVTISGAAPAAAPPRQPAGGAASSGQSQPDWNVTGGPDVPCPYCGSRQTTMESAFGPTRCRMIYYCPACRSSFEYLKDVRPESTTP